MKNMTELKKKASERKLKIEKKSKDADANAEQE